MQISTLLSSFILVSLYATTWLAPVAQHIFQLLRTNQQESAKAYIQSVPSMVSLEVELACHVECKDYLQFFQEVPVFKFTSQQELETMIQAVQFLPGFQAVLAKPRLNKIWSQTRACSFGQVNKVTVMRIAQGLLTASGIMQGSVSVRFQYIVPKRIVSSIAASPLNIISGETLLSRIQNLTPDFEAKMQMNEAQRRAEIDSVRQIRVSYQQACGMNQDAAAMFTTLESRIDEYFDQRHIFWRTKYQDGLRDTFVTDRYVLPTPPYSGVLEIVAEEKRRLINSCNV